MGNDYFHEKHGAHLALPFGAANVTTNADHLARIVSHPAFAAGRVHTGFIPLYDADLKPSPLSEEQRNLLLAAAALSSRVFIDPAFHVPEPYASIGNWRN